MRKREIYKKLSKTAKLPTPSQVALEVMRLCYSDDSSLQDIAKVVETDPAMSAEFLKYANSAIMASPVPVASVQRAAVKIGMKGMVNLALSFSLLSQQHSECSGFSYTRFWSKSLAQAVAGRALAKSSTMFDPDEIFTCCLLSHIGELAFASAFPEDYSSLLNQELTSLELLVAEQNSFGIDHHELTAEMFEDWGLPKPFRAAVLLHENLQLDDTHDQDINTLAELLHLALQISDICMLDLPLQKTFTFIENLAVKFGVPRATFNQFFDDIVQAWQEWGYLHQIPTQQCPLYHQIKTLEETSIEEQVRSRTDAEIQILAVDDDPMTLLNLSRILKTHPKRRILTAEDGKEALSLALEYQPEMVITDWRMPNMDGLQLCEALRNSSTTQHSYIIMLTGVEAEDELVQAFDAGADDYVVKPFTPKVLEARIRSGERLIRYQRTITFDREVIQKYAAKLASANRKLQTMAMTDALTGLPNRRSAMARMKDVVAESSRYSEKLSCIMIDIDHFKQVNDTLGHDNGDLVLKEAAQIFLNNARSYDMVSRMGGEEFLVISTRSDQEESQQLAERLRAAIESHTVNLTDGTTAKITISVGVATWDDTIASGSELIKAADNALYRAKQKGRNRVEYAWNNSA